MGRTNNRARKIPDPAGPAAKGIPSPAGPAGKPSIAQRASRLAGTLSGKQEEQSRPGLNFTLETDSEGDDSVKSVPRTASDEDERRKASKSSNTNRGRPGLNFTLETGGGDDCEPAFAMNTKSNTKYIIPEYQKTRNSYEGDLSHLSTFQHSEENVAALSAPSSDTRNPNPTLANLSHFSSFASGPSMSNPEPPDSRRSWTREPIGSGPMGPGPMGPGGPMGSGGPMGGPLGGPGGPMGGPGGMGPRGMGIGPGGPIMGGPGMNQGMGPGMGMNPADVGHVGPGSMGPGGPNMGQGFSMGPGGPHSMNPGMGGPGMGMGPGMTGPSMGRPMGSGGPVGPRNNGGPTPLMGSTGNRLMNFDVSLKPSVGQMSSMGGPMGPGGPVRPRNNVGPIPLMVGTGNRLMNLDVSLKPSVSQMSQQVQQRPSLNFTLDENEEEAENSDAEEMALPMPMPSKAKIQKDFKKVAIQNEFKKAKTGESDFQRIQKEMTPQPDEMALPMPVPTKDRKRGQKNEALSTESEGGKTPLDIPSPSGPAAKPGTAVNPVDGLLLGSNPLSILQLYGMGQVTAFEDGKNVIFGDLSWPKDVKTNFRMSGWEKQGAKDWEYYTLESLLYFVNNKSEPHPGYCQKASFQGIKAVRRPDRKALLNYFKGDEDAANIKSIDKSAPVIQATNLKRPSQRQTPVRDLEEPSAEGEDDEDENGQADLSDEDMPCMSLPAPVPAKKKKEAEIKSDFKKAAIQNDFKKIQSDVGQYGSVWDNLGFSEPMAPRPLMGGPMGPGPMRGGPLGGPSGFAQHPDFSYGGAQLKAKSSKSMIYKKHKEPAANRPMNFVGGGALSTSSKTPASNAKSKQVKPSKPPSGIIPSSSFGKVVTPSKVTTTASKSPADKAKSTKGATPASLPKPSGPAKSPATSKQAPKTPAAKQTAASKATNAASKQATATKQTPKQQAKSTKPAAKKQPAQIEDDDDGLPAFHTQNAGPSGSKTQNSDLPGLSAMGPGPRGPRPWRSWGPGPMGPGPMGPMPMMGGPMGPGGPRMLGGPMGWGMGRGGPMAFF